MIGNRLLHSLQVRVWIDITFLKANSTKCTKTFIFFNAEQLTQLFWDIRLKEIIKDMHCEPWASLEAQMVENLSIMRKMQEVWVPIPGLGRSPGGGNSNPLQCSCLENPMDRGAWRATVHGVAKSWTCTTEHTCVNVYTNVTELHTWKWLRWWALCEFCHNFLLKC